jgi:hypothetical protein
MPKIFNDNAHTIYFSYNGIGYEIPPQQSLVILDPLLIATVVSEDNTGDMIGDGEHLED